MNHISLNKLLSKVASNFFEIFLDFLKLKDMAILQLLKRIVQVKQPYQMTFVLGLLLTSLGIENINAQQNGK